MRRPNKFSQPVDQGPRINDKIRETEVRLIDGEGGQVGVVSIQEALDRADEAGLDLVEVSPQAKPPVCKLIDYGKYKYQQSKKAHEAKKKQAVVEVKEVSLTPNTDVHDIKTKQNHIRRWVEGDRSRVKVSVKFRGREMSHQELGFRVIDQLLDGIDDIVTKEGRPRFEGRRLTVTLMPKAEVPAKTRKTSGPAAEKGVSGAASKDKNSPPAGNGPTIVTPKL